MPLYDYKCRTCGQISVLMVSYTGKCQNFVCVTCGSVDLEKQLSIPVILKQCNPGGLTCCGAEERCETSPCHSGGGGCHGH